MTPSMGTSAGPNLLDILKLLAMVQGAGAGTQSGAISGPSGSPMSNASPLGSLPARTPQQTVPYSPFLPGAFSPNSGNSGGGNMLSSLFGSGGGGGGGIGSMLGKGGANSYANLLGGGKGASAALGAAPDYASMLASGLIAL